MLSSFHTAVLCLVNSKYFWYTITCSFPNSTSNIFILPSGNFNINLHSHTFVYLFPLTTVTDSVANTSDVYARIDTNLKNGKTLIFRSTTSCTAFICTITGTGIYHQRHKQIVFQQDVAYIVLLPYIFPLQSFPCHSFYSFGFPLSSHILATKTPDNKLSSDVFF